MLPAELVKQIHLLEISTRGAVNEIIGGAYHSVFKGRGIEFEEVREYSDNDDARDIDWNVSARMGSPYIKKYIEERELSVMLLVDVSASGSFGSGVRTKRQTAAELAALLAFSAGFNHDKVGMLLFSDRMEEYLPPRSGRKHTLRLIRDLLAFEPRRRRTDIASALREVQQLLSKRSVIFLISDFEDYGSDYATALKLANQRHDVIAVRILDKLERRWNIEAAFEIEDAETGEVVSFSGDAAGCAAFTAASARDQQHCAQVCRAAKVDLVELACDENPLPPLIGFFERRKARSAGR